MTSGSIGTQRTCDRCASVVGDDEVFCGYCHYRLPEPEAPVAPVRDVTTDGPHPTDTGTGPANHGAGRRRTIVAAAVVAIAVVVAAAISLAGDDAPDRDGNGATDTPQLLAAMLARPERQWERELGGEPTGFAAADGRLFAVVASDEGTSVVSIDHTTGEGVWSFQLDAEPGTGAGSLAVTDDGVAVLHGSSLLPTGELVVLDPDTGAPQWRADTELGVFGLDGDRLYGSAADGRDFAQPIDASGRRLLPAVSFDRSFFPPADDPVGGDRSDSVPVLLDDRGVLRSVDPFTLQPDGRIALEHDAEVVGVGRMSNGDVLVGTGETLITMTPGGAAAGSSSDPGVGRISGIGALGPDAFLVDGDLGFRVVDVSVPGAIDVGDVRSFESVAATHRFDGRAIAVTVQSSAAAFGDSTVTVLADTDDEPLDLTPRGTVTDFIAPQLVASGPVLYLLETSLGGGYDVQRRIAAYSIVDASPLWSLDLADDDLARLTDTGLVVIGGARGGGEATLRYYEPPTP